MADMVVSEKTFRIATGKRTLTGETDARGEPITRPETRDLPAYVPFDGTLLRDELTMYLAEGTVVMADSPEGRVIAARAR